MKTATQTLLTVAAALIFLALSADLASAQTAGRRRVRRASGVTGVEMGLEGSLSAPRGGHLRWLLSTYEVVGLQNLRPARGATITLTTSLDPREVAAEVTTDEYGRAVIELDVPDDAPASFRAVLRVRSASEIQRRFELTVRTTEPRQLTLFTARQTVQPGGRVQLFGRLHHLHTGRPLPQETVRLTLRDGANRLVGDPVEVVTDRSGLWSRTIRLPRDVAGAVNVEARLVDDEHPVIARAAFSVAEPRSQAMLVTVDAGPVIVPSLERRDLRVVVRTPNGRPLAGALVTLDGARRDRPGAREVTGPSGWARLAWTAPRVQAGFRDTTISVTVRREGVGEAHGSTRVRVAATRYAGALAVEGGALAPPLGGRVWVRVTGIDGHAAGPGIPVTLDGPRVTGSTPLRAATDRSGIATFDVDLGPNRGGAADRCGGDNATAADVVIGEGATRAEIQACLPLDPDATARVRVTPPRVSAGGQVTVEVARADAARRLPVAVALLRRTDRGLEALSSRVLPARESRLDLELPLDVVGQVVVRARPLVGAERQEVRGGSALLWVSPGLPTELRLVVTDHAERATLTFPDDSPGAREVYLVGLPIDEARALADRLRATTYGPLGDLRLPRGSASDALVAAALAAATPRDAGAPAVLRDGDLVPVPAPEDPVEVGLLRDPWRSRARFVTGRMALIFRAVEREVANALPDRLDDVAVREGPGRWSFNSEIIEAISNHPSLGSAGATGLGGDPLTIEAIQSFDRAFTYDNVARRITRERLFRLVLALRQFVQSNDFDLPWSRRGDPAEWLRSLPGRHVPGAGSLSRTDLVDGWGRPFQLRRARGGRTRFTFVSPLGGWELISTGPDGVAGNGDDLWDPTARVLPQRSAYAEAVGEDVLVARLQGVELGRATVDLLRSSVSIFRSSVGGIPSRPEAASEQLTRQLWDRLPAIIEQPPDPFVLRRPQVPGDGALGRVVSVPRVGATTALDFDDEPRTWGVVGWAWTRDGSGAVGWAPTTAGAPILVESVLPRRLRQGEQVQVPLMITNLTNEPLLIEGALEVSGPLEARPPVAISLDPGEAGGTLFQLRGTSPGRAHGRLELRAGDRLLRRLDLRLRVESRLMPVRLRHGVAMADRRWRTTLDLPGDAEGLAGRVVVMTPRGLASDPDLADVRRRDPALIAWAETLAGRSMPPALRTALFRAQRPDGAIEGDEDALSTACALLAWSAAGADDEEAMAALSRARRAFSSTSPFGDIDGMAGVLRTAAALLAAVAPGGVPELLDSGEAARDPVARQSAELRVLLRRAIHLFPEEPTLLALASGALLLADPRDGHGRAMLERAEAHLVATADGGARVAGSERRAGLEESLSATLALAVAAHQVQRDDLAERLVRGAFTAENVLTRAGGEPTFWMLAAAAYGAMGAGSPERVTVTIEGRTVNADLREGRAVIPMERLSGGQSIGVTVERLGGPILLARGEVVMGRRFETRDDGPLRLELNGDLGLDGDVAALELSVTALRDVRDAVVDVQLPSGIDARERLVELVSRSSSVVRAEARRPGYLRLHLTPFDEGVTRVVPLPLRWTLRGNLHGLGVIAYPRSEPSAMTVLAPRRLTIE